MIYCCDTVLVSFPSLHPTVNVVLARQKSRFLFYFQRVLRETGKHTELQSAIIPETTSSLVRLQVFSLL